MTVRAGVAGETARAATVTISLSLVGIAAAFAIWAIGITATDVRGMNDLGLVSVLPPATVAGPMLLTLSFALVLLAEPMRTRLVVLHIVAMVFMLYALPTLVEEVPRFNVAWRHVGITEVLTRTGEIHPEIDAYFSWPGFFALAALLTEIAGLDSALDLVAWAPVAFNLLYLAPLVLIYRAGAQDQRVVWLAAWVFYVANWIGQDYFAPQAFAYFLYLMILAIALTWFGRDPDPIPPIPRSWFRPFKPVITPHLTPVQRAGLFSILVLFFAVTVVSHQLTPFAAVGVILALVVVRRISPTGLPIVMLVVLGTWISYMTVTYMEGHLRDMVARIGAVDTAVAANLTDRFSGSDQHVFVLSVRAMTTLVLWSLAAYGAARRVVAGEPDLTWLFLAGAPFGLFLLQDYGGEILLRIYLFSLPFMSLLAANALLGLRSAPGWRPVTATALALLLLLGGFLVSRYGNERMDIASAAEVEGIEWLYATAPHDTLLVAASDNIFWRHRDYELYRYDIVTDELLEMDTRRVVERMVDTRGGRAYLILSRAQRAALELRYGLQPSEWDEIQQRFDTAPELSLAYENDDIRIYEVSVGGTAS
jgi:hypothetical protein